MDKVVTSKWAAIASEFGTPTLVFDETMFVSRLRAFREAVSFGFDEFGIKWSAVYASKAFASSSLDRLVGENGYGVDTCSYAEAMTALQGGVSGTLLGLHGNNKSNAELALAIDNQFARIVVDSIDEIDTISNILARKPINTPINLMLRVTTGIHAGGHEYISTAHEDQKFGISITDGQALSALERLHQLSQKHPNVKLIGIHTHIGSQITASSAFLESAIKMLTLRTSFALETGIWLPEVDLGGGFGVQYTDSDDELDLPQLFKELGLAILEHCTENDAQIPRISFEPGRWLIAPCMSTLYSIGTIKDVKLDNGKIRRYISVDGGMSDNIRPILYGAKYSADIVRKSKIGQNNLELENGEVLTTPSRVVGKHCESGDILIENIDLPLNTQRGDLLIIPVTGAYSYSMASNYNMLPKPAIVKLIDDLPEIMKPRQVWQDLVW